jgi:hypothetical protein
MMPGSDADPDPYLVCPLAPECPDPAPSKICAEGQNVLWLGDVFLDNGNLNTFLREIAFSFSVWQNLVIFNFC